jgi:hypothetical protein
MHDLATTIPAAASIFALAWFSFWPSMPAGIALGLHPLLVIVVTTLSYVSGVVIVLLPGERVRVWVERRFRRKSDDGTAEPAPDTRLRRIWARYGTAGFGLLAPMTVGAQIGAILGLALDIPPRRLFVWMTIGALAWSILLTAVALGLFDALRDLLA